MPAVTMGDRVNWNYSTATGTERRTGSILGISPTEAYIRDSAGNEGWVNLRDLEPAPARGYLTEFVVSYQLEGDVTEAVAIRVAEAVRAALRTNLPELASAAAEVGADRTVTHVRVQQRGDHLTEELS